MVSKQKVGFVRALLRRNSTPVFCALLPREEDEETGDPAGFHLIPLPFADDLREAPVTEGKRGKSFLLFPFAQSFLLPSLNLFTSLYSTFFRVFTHPFLLRSIRSFLCLLGLYFRTLLVKPR